MSQNVINIPKIDKRDIDIAGKYAVELGELSRIGVPIPEGFVVTANCFKEFITENKFESIPTDKQIMHISMPSVMVSQINKSYKELGSTFNESRVVLILSSPFGFKNISYDVKGDANLLLKIKEIWANQFTKISLLENKINNSNDFHKLDIAIIVQEKINNQKNGKIFTQDPLTSDKSKIVIDLKNTSHYLISKQNLDIIFKGHISRAKIFRKLSDKEAVKLAILGIKIEKHFYFPQEIIFSIDRNKIYILETKPMTDILPKPAIGNDLPHLSHVPRKSKIKRDILLKGKSYFPGIVTGPVKVITNFMDLENIIPGEIIVLPKIEPDLFPKLRKAGAIVLKNHSFTGRDKFLYRTEVGKPSIVDVKDASSVLHSGNVVTVNGERGEIYKGGLN